MKPFQGNQIDTDDNVGFSQFVFIKYGFIYYI